MSREERRAAKRAAKDAHGDAVGAFFAQNGKQPPRRYRQPEPEPQTPSPARPAGPPADWKDWLDPATRAAIEGLEASAPERSAAAQRDYEELQQAKADREGETEQRAYWDKRLDDERKTLHQNHQIMQDVQNGKSGQMAHKDEIQGLLSAAQTEIANNVAAKAQQALDLITQATQLIVSTENAIGSAAGYTRQAYSESQLGSYLGNLSNDMVTTIEHLHVALSAVEGYAGGASAMVGMFGDQMAREAAANQ